MLKDIRRYLLNDEFEVNIYDKYVHINNYLKIITLEENRISVSSLKRIVIIKGSNLSIIKLLEKEMLISGNVSEVVFNEL